MNSTATTYRRIPAAHAPLATRQKWDATPRPARARGTVGEKPAPVGGSTNSMSPPHGGFGDDNPGPDGDCGEGFESREIKAGSGEYRCVDKATDCIRGYEPDPNDKTRCRFKLAGQPCGGGDYKYDEDGNCVSPTGEKYGQEECGRVEQGGCPGGKSVFTTTTPAPAPAGMPTWQKAGLVVLGLLAIKKIFFPMKGRR